MNARIPNETRRAVYKRDHYRCALCDSTDGIQIHHAIHRGQGGNNTMHNMITLCWRCHAQAHGTPVFDHSELTQADIDLACVEYLADYDAPDWMPYRPDWWYRYTHPVR